MSCGIMHPGDCVKDAAKSAIEALAHAIADSCAWMIKESFTWWVDTSTDGVNTSVVDSIRHVMLPVTIAVAVAGVILVGIKMVVSGKPDPLISLGEGLFKLAFWTTCGTATVNLFMSASAGFSKWVLDQAAGRDFGARLSEVFALNGLQNMFGAMIFLGILGFLSGVVQWILGLLREGSVIVLTGCLPLAAAGQLAGFGRAWLPKIFGWTLALIFWEPTASLVYFAAFKLIGKGRGPTEVLIGLSMMMLSILALPVLIKLFSWASGSVMDSGGGGTLSSLANLGASALRLQASRDGGGAQPISAAQHAQMISQNLPEPGQNPQGATPSAPSSPDNSGGNGDSPGAPPAPSTPPAQQGDPGAGIPAQSTGAPVNVGTGAEAAGQATATTAAAGAAKVAGPAGVAVEAGQIVHGAANSAANNMTNPPASE